jgi:galactokinase
MARIVGHHARIPRAHRTPERVVAFAPGRVNVIGEHTDYNDGLCLPFAIDSGVTVAAERADGPEVVAEAADFGETDRFALADPPPADGWRAFVRGAVAELRAAGHEIPAARLRISGDVPVGAGLSSSAAIEVALCLALLALAGDDAPDPVALARLCSRVEHEWVGAQTGLLDQLAALCSRADHAIRLDCRSLEIEPVPLDLAGWTLGLVDSGTRHEFSAPGGYNERRAECAAAARALGVASLRAVAESDLARLDGVLQRRVRHVLTENARVEAAVAALRAGDLPELARLLDASHVSLRDDYDVSVPEVEATRARVKDGGAAGARIMGGGFGGAVLALFPPEAAPPPETIVVRPGPAARVTV